MNFWAVKAREVTAKGDEGWHWADYLCVDDDENWDMEE